MFSLYTYREKCPAHWRPCFSPIWTIFELVGDINKTNVLTNFHDDWAKIVTSRVSRPLAAMFFNGPEPLLNSTNMSLRQTFWQSYMKIGHKMWLLQCLQGFSFFWPSDLVFDPAWPSFELSRGINVTNVLTKFQEDQTINVASRVFKRQMLTAHDGRRTKGDHKSSPWAHWAQVR